MCDRQTLVNVRRAVRSVVMVNWLNGIKYYVEIALLNVRTCLPCNPGLEAFIVICASCMQEYFENIDKKSTAVDMYRFAQTCLAKCTCRVMQSSAYVRFL